MGLEVVLGIIIIVAILAAAYPTSHAVDHLKGNSPPPDVQEVHDKREKDSLLILVVCLILGALLVSMLYVPN